MPLYDKIVRSLKAIILKVCIGFARENQSLQTQMIEKRNNTFLL